MSLARTTTWLLLAALAGCGGSAARPAPAAPPTDARASSPEARIAVLRALSALDRRVALRAGIRPPEEEALHVTMGALLAEDTSVGLIEGSIDPFSFAARGRGLEQVRVQTTALQEPPAAPSKWTSDRVLLQRLVDAEEVRLAEERNLPRSASSLVRAMVTIWVPPRSPREAEERDRLLSRRLGEVRAALEKSADAASLDGPRARELDDALDALEKQAEISGLRASLGELVKLRDALESRGGGPSPTTSSSWDELAPRLRAQLGTTQSAEEIDRQLADVEAASRTAAEEARAKLPRETLAQETEPLLFAQGPCVDAVPGSPVRSMAAPPEREAGCLLRHAVAAARDERSRAAALAALHDHVTVARWALDVARGVKTMDQAEATHHLLSPPGHVLRARLERVAIVRPTSAIDAGLVAALLVEGGASPEERAKRWASIGDVPLDVARRELTP